MKYNTPRFRVLTSAALLLAFLAAPVAAQPAPQSPAQPSQPQGARGLTHTNDAPVSVLPDKSKRYALIIGIDEYTADTNITRLNGAANDARAIANALITHAGFERDKVILLTSDQTDQTRQPVRNVILGALKNLKNLVEKDGMLVVAFSGHGVERQRDHQVFLLPADALSNPEDYDDTAISVARVKELIKQTQASQVMLILDSCRNDPTAGRGSEDNKLTQNYINAFNFGERNSGIRAFVTLYAASEGERAWEYRDKKQGYFSWALVEGLRGSADTGRDGEVTLGELKRYIQTEVPRRAQWEGKRQTPYPVVEGFADELVLSVNETVVKARAAERAEAARVKAAAEAAARVPVVVAPALPKTGSLTVVSEPGALVTVKPAAGAKGVPVQKSLPEGQRSGLFDELQPGSYVAVATREGFATVEKTFEVVAGKQATLELPLRQVLHNVTLKLNVAKGRVEFGIKGEPRQMVEFQGGQAALANLRRGDYLVRVVPEEVGYLSKTESLAVASDATVEYKLERRLTERAFAADFASEQWGALPSGWRGAAALEVNGAGAAILRGDAVRYADLQLNANVRLTNGAGVSFIVRALDDRNYYLVRVGGPRADTANKLTLFVVKNGARQTVGTFPLNHFKLDDGFLLIVKAAGNRFDFFIDDNTGRTEPSPVGVLFDEARAFAAGTLGVAAERGDQASVSQFYACPNECAKVTAAPEGVRLP